MPVGTKLQLDLQRQGKDLKADVTTVPAEFLIPSTDGHDCNPSYDPAASDATSVNDLETKCRICCTPELAPCPSVTKWADWVAQVLDLRRVGVCTTNCAVVPGKGF